MDNSSISIGPSVCFKVQKIIGVSIGEGNLRNYQVQWAPSWVSGFHLIGCEKLIEEFVGGEVTDTGACRFNGETATVSPKAEQVSQEVSALNSTEFSSLASSSTGDNHSNGLSAPDSVNKDSYVKLSTDDPCTSGMLQEDIQGYRNIEQENPNFEWASTGREVKKIDFIDKSMPGNVDALKLVEDYSEDQDKNNKDKYLNESSIVMRDVLKLQEDIIIIEPSECEEQNNQSKKKPTHKCSKCQNTFFRTAIELQRHYKRVHSSKKKVDNILGIVERSNNNTNSKSWVNDTIPGTSRTSSSDDQYDEDFKNISEGDGKGTDRDHNNNTTTSNNSISYNKYNDVFNDKVKSTLSDKGYKCGVCSKMFSNNSNLHVHMRLHTGQRAHQCGFCSKLFPSKTELRRHERVHTGERPFLCRVCLKTFKRNDHLKKHLQTHRIMM